MKESGERRWGGQDPAEKVMLSKDVKEGREGATRMSGGRRIPVLRWECLEGSEGSRDPGAVRAE